MGESDFDPRGRGAGTERASSISLSDGFLLSLRETPPRKLTAHPTGPSAQPHPAFHKWLECGLGLGPYRDTPASSTGLRLGLFCGWASVLFRRDLRQPRDRTLIGMVKRKGSLPPESQGSIPHTQASLGVSVPPPSGCLSKPEFQATAGHHRPEGRQKSLVAAPTRFLGAAIVGGYHCPPA